ncbi:metal-dependent hydrolase [Nocardiopsis changdeensis]|uniref:Metal-dependent hydrolase n=1 Tax=Nocardiopsis changdeensis TaxID=2831969 RepID=A0ABX8BSV5_9ACTN|nr:MULTISPECIES: metal-dependent hydrolase [Nocardiopsis]QUX25325.1 metal-dependent hydrolase [Nocardiopsis changdeensis]QYX35712.1 metal-dependent hydrolase [Nocardiopsis sp. MT53]
MMGTSHAATGLLAGAAVAVAVQTDPFTALWCALIGGGAALLPDLDEPGSTVGRSLGRVTELASRKLRDASKAVYRRTATDVERRHPQEGGHRYLTHTVPACAVFGLVALLVSLVPLGAGLVVFAMVALGLGTVLRPMKKLGSLRKRKHATLWIAGGLAVAAMLGYEQTPAWWLIGSVVFAGALVHVLGDWLTRSGVPLAWPFVVNGKRWWMFRSPVAFHTGKSPVEVGIRVVSVIAAPVTVLLGSPVPPV